METDTKVTVKSEITEKPVAKPSRNRGRQPKMVKSKGKLAKVKAEESLTDEEKMEIKPVMKRNHDNLEFDDVKPKKLKIEYQFDDQPCSSASIKMENEQLWEDYELLAETQQLSRKVARITIKLFDEGNTIPFIARYRKDATENLSPEQLRDIKEEYDRITAVKAKSQTVLKSIEKSGNLDAPLKQAILSARTLEELEHLYAPYKPGTKRSLAERAKALGLDSPATDLINCSKSINPESYVDATNKDLRSVLDVEKGLMHIIASVIATDTEALSFLRKVRLDTNFSIESKKSTSKKDGASAKTKNKETNTNKKVDEMKFATYFDFKIPVRFIKPHQVLALNRGESLKILSVKVVVPDYLFNKFSNFCAVKWVNKGKFDRIRTRILEMSVNDAYTRLVQPYIIREVRSELKTKAEKASYEVFSTNLKQLLLMPPLKGKPILGIDPGFSNGCKLAVISETGALLSNAVIYPHKNKSTKDANILENLLKNHNCNTIALGNGTACRETETWLSGLLQTDGFAAMNVTYTIVNESGASIYSCSSEAKKEFPSLDPNIISAVSLARRVQEPLAELVKVEPKHLGVGMYQHDLPKKQLEQALDEVVTECVSFVGVDLNTASQCLLRRIAGLTDKRATHIIEHREKNGTFRSRKQLLDVKGIGPRVFEQCAGFLRVAPANVSQSGEFYKHSSANRLDCTYIHPESYDVAAEVVKKLNLNIRDIGQPQFISTVKCQMQQLNVPELSSSFNSSVQTVTLILETLSKPLNFDLRSECSQAPLFKKGLTSIHDLRVGCLVTGSVNNVTHFGCFVDIGVGQDGLIHQSKLSGFSLQVGDRVEVRVINIEAERKRIGLQMVNKI